MASFYGSYITSAGGEGGTTDYNQLSNSPIKNITGTESVPVILAALECGLYAITGYFQCGENTEKESTQKLLIAVLYDEKAQKKMVKYDLFEGGEYYIVTVEAGEDNSAIIDRLLITNGGGSGGDDSSDFAKTAEELILFTF